MGYSFILFLIIIVLFYIKNLDIIKEYLFYYFLFFVAFFGIFKISFDALLSIILSLLLTTFFYFY